MVLPSPLELGVPSHCDSHRSFLKWLTSFQDPQKRVSMDQLKRHPWLAQSLQISPTKPVPTPVSAPRIEPSDFGACASQKHLAAEKSGCIDIPPPPSADKAHEPLISWVEEPRSLQLTLQSNPELHALPAWSSPGILHALSSDVSSPAAGSMTKKGGLSGLFSKFSVELPRSASSVKAQSSKSMEIPNAKRPSSPLSPSVQEGGGVPGKGSQLSPISDTPAKPKRGSLGRDLLRKLQV